MHRLRDQQFRQQTNLSGNGNISVLLDSADGTLDAKYEYGAFGEPLRVSGDTIAADNPFRFSTKYLDSDGARKRVDGDAEGVARRAEEAGALWALMRQSGLIYYGFRYYSPSLGRFLNRDPIGEAGGTNLYAFVENDPVNGWDYMGYGMDYIGGPGCESQCLSYMAEWEYPDFETCMEACEGPRSDRWRAEFSVENKYHHEIGYYFFWDDYEDDEYLDDRECSESSGRSGVRVIDPMESIKSDTIKRIEIKTIIRPPAPQAGMKSLHVVTVDIEKGVILNSYHLTGTTDFGPFELGSVRDKFEALYHNVGDIMNIIITGETASPVQVLPNINYSFQISIDRKTGNITLSGEHDGYPSYTVSVDGKQIYDHQQGKLYQLFGEVDTKVGEAE